MASQYEHASAKSLEVKLELAETKRGITSHTNFLPNTKFCNIFFVFLGATRTEGKSQITFELQ